LREIGLDAKPMHEHGRQRDHEIGDAIMSILSAALLTVAILLNGTHATCTGSGDDKNRDAAL